MNDYNGNQLQQMLLGNDYNARKMAITKYQDTYEKEQLKLLSYLEDEIVLVVKSHLSKAVTINVYGDYHVHIPSIVWEMGEKKMLCTICRQRLNTTDYPLIWRTVKPIKLGELKEWARLPMHHGCEEQAKQMLLTAKISLAAGYSSYEYSFTKPDTTLVGRQLDDEWIGCVPRYRW